MYVCFILQRCRPIAVINDRFVLWPAHIILRNFDNLHTYSFTTFNLYFFPVEECEWGRFEAAASMRFHSSLCKSVSVLRL